MVGFPEFISITFLKKIISSTRKEFLSLSTWRILSFLELKPPRNRVQRPIIHEGLIFLITEFYHDNNPSHSISTSSCKQKRETKGSPSKRETIGDSLLKNKSSCHRALAMGKNFEHILKDVEEVATPLDDDTTQTMSDGCSFENKDVTLSQDDTSALDSLLSSPNIVNKHGKNSSYKSKDIVPSSKHKIIKIFFSSLKTKQATINEETKSLVKMEDMNDSKDTSTKGIDEAINLSSNSHEMETIVTPIIANLTLDPVFVDYLPTISDHDDTNLGKTTAHTQKPMEKPQLKEVSEEAQGPKEDDIVL